MEFECVDNEFKRIMDDIQKKYLFSQQEIADRLGIEIVSLIRYYMGVRKPKQELLDKLNELYNISKEEFEIIQREKEKKAIFYEITHKLSNLNDEHKKEVFDLISSYYEEETNPFYKKLTND